MEKTVQKPAASKPATAVAKKPVSTKGLLEKKLKALEKATVAACAEIQKKIVAKSGKAEGASEISGLNRDDLMKLVTVLDNIGGTTYPTACTLRDIHRQMK